MLKKLLFTAALVMLPLAPAMADPYHHGWDHRDHYNHYRGHSRVSFNIGVVPYYPGPYYAPRVVYAVPPAAPAPDVIYINNDNSHVVDTNDGRYCREYQSHVRVAGKLQETYGTACMQPDGSWQIVN